MVKLAILAFNTLLVFLSLHLRKLPCKNTLSTIFSFVMNCVHVSDDPAINGKRKAF